MIKLPPLPHQPKIIDAVLQHDQFALIGDPGIGKTYIMLSVIEIKNYKKVLVICPKSVIDTGWNEDIPNFTDFTYSVIWDKNFSKRALLLGNERIHVINYDVVDRMFIDLVKQKYDCIILDESTFIKKHNNKRTKACLKLGKIIPNRYILTGTPGYAVDKLWSQFFFINPKIWDDKNFWDFQEKYFYKIDIGGMNIYKFNKRYISEINERIYRQGLRVLKDEVQKHLPKRNFIIRLLDIPRDAKKIYDTFDKDGIVGDIYTFYSPVQRIKLRQMASGSIINDQRGKEKEIISLHNVKYKEVQRIIEDDIEEDEQILIWANFEEEFKKLHELTGYPMVCGGVNYQQTLRDFKHGRIKGIIAHPRSISWGVTFVKCHHNIFFGLTDDLECFQQSLDRTHRHGQTISVSYHFILCRDTIDEDILKTHRKNKLLESDLTNQRKKMSLQNLLFLELI